MANAGVDSFWKVSNEHVAKADKDAAAFAPYRVPALLLGDRVSFPNSQAARPNVQLPPAFGDKNKASSSDTKSYKNERRLKVGYRLNNSSMSRVEDLFGSGVRLPTRGSVDAIQTDDELWIVSEALSRVGDNVRLHPDLSKVAVPVANLETTPALMDLKSGLVIFIDDPRFVAVGSVDFRSGTEVAGDTDRWLERISQSVKSTEVDRSRIADLRKVLQHYVDETAGAGEMAELSAAMRILEGRTELLALIPAIVRQDDVWSSEVASQLALEASQRRQEAEAAFAAEKAALIGQLAGLQDQIKQGQVDLELIGQKRQAYEDAKRDLDQAINAAIKTELATLEAAQDYVRRPELESVEAELKALKAPQPIPVSIPPVTVPTQTDVAPAPSGYVLVPGQDRKTLLAELARVSGTKFADLLVLLACRGTGRLPVLTGAGASDAASAIVQGLSQASPMMLFCDPTLVSMQDLLNAPGTDGEQTLRDAIAFAKSNLEIIVPVGLHALTKSPCEFWLPPLLVGQQAGHLPGNMLFIGSTEPDGNRFAIPPSMLDRLLPIDSSLQAGGRPGVKRAPGAWPSGSTRPGPEFIKGLLDLNLDAGHLQEVKTSAGGLLNLFECDVETFKEGIGTQLDWLNSLGGAEPNSHPQMRHFAALEN